MVSAASFQPHPGPRHRVAITRPLLASFCQNGPGPSHRPDHATVTGFVLPKWGRFTMGLVPAVRAQCTYGVLAPREGKSGTARFDWSSCPSAKPKSVCAVDRGPVPARDAQVRSAARLHASPNNEFLQTVSVGFPASGRKFFTRAFVSTRIQTRCLVSAEASRPHKSKRRAIPGNRSYPIVWRHAALTKYAAIAGVQYPRNRNGHWMARLWLPW